MATCMFLIPVAKSMVIFMRNVTCRTVFAWRYHRRIREMQHANVSITGPVSTALSVLAIGTLPRTALSAGTTGLVLIVRHALKIGMLRRIAVYAATAGPEMTATSVQKDGTPIKIAVKCVATDLLHRARNAKT